MVKRVYIAHPFQGKQENLNRITANCRILACDQVMPVSPIHMLSFLDEFNPPERELALKFGLSELTFCQDTFLFGDWRKSVGCLGEYDQAIQLGVRIVDVEVCKDDDPNQIADILEIPLLAAKMLKEYLLYAK